MDAAMLIKLLILVGAAFFLGFRLGQGPKHTYGGEIVFEKQPDGEEKCIFKLEEGEAWLSRQKSVVFKIEHTGGNTQYVEDAYDK